MVVEGLLVWMTYLALAFGKPLAFSTAQAQWERGIGAPNYTVTRAIVATVYGLRKIVSAEYYRLFWEVPRPGSEYSTLGTNIFNLLVFITAALLLWYGARRLPGAYSWYALAALAYPLFFPSKFVPLMSYPRFTLTVFPLYVALALYTRDRPRLHKVVVVVGVARCSSRSRPSSPCSAGWPEAGQGRRRRRRPAPSGAGSAPAARGGGRRGQGAADEPGDGVAPGEGDAAPGAWTPSPASIRLKTYTPSLA